MLWLGISFLKKKNINSDMGFFYFFHFHFMIAGIAKGLIFEDGPIRSCLLCNYR